MKVILKSEVDNLGLPGDVVDVADGFGRNYLIPRGLAIHASRGAMKEAEAMTRARKAREAKTVGQAASFKAVLEERVLRVPARVDDRGHLYGSVSVNDVARILKERGHDIERRRIDLKGSIKEIGEYEIPVRVHPQVVATVTVEVVDEEGVVTLESLRQASVPAPLPGAQEEAVPAVEGVEQITTDVDALAEAALEAAQAYEQEGPEEVEGTEPTEGSEPAAEGAEATETATSPESTSAEASEQDPETS